MFINIDDNCVINNGIGTNFGVGVGEARPEGPTAEAASPSPPAMEFTRAL